MTFDEDLLSPAILADPYPYFHRLRAEDPLHWSERYHAWLLTRYDDVSFAARDPRFSADRLTTFLAEKVPPEARERFDPIARLFSSWMVFKDPPDHGRLRRLVHMAFSGRMVERLRREIEGVADELLSALLSRPRADFVADFAALLPAIVIARMIGVPEADQQRFRAWSEDLKPLVLLGVADPDRHERARRGFLALEAYFRGLLASARRAPGDDLLGALVQAKERDDSLSDDEVIGNLILLLFAGHETTTNLLASALLALDRNPAERERLAADPSLVRSAVEEFLRYDGPSRLMPRYVRADVELRGRRIRKGERAFLVQAAANRDPERFADPDRLDLGRTDNDHVAFGFGIHHCLGAPLARLEAAVAIDALVPHLARIRVATERPEWREALLIRSLKALPITVVAGGPHPARVAQH